MFHDTLYRETKVVIDNDVHLIIQKRGSKIRLSFYKFTNKWELAKTIDINGDSLPESSSF